MPTFDLEFEVYCDTCRDGLCNRSITTVGRNRGVPQVRVEACETCMQRAREDGAEEAHRAAEAERAKAEAYHNTESRELQERIAELEAELAAMQAAR